jgi:hypothetical protein
MVSFSELFFLSSFFSQNDIHEQIFNTLTTNLHLIHKKIHVHWIVEFNSNSIWCIWTPLKVLCNVIQYFHLKVQKINEFTFFINWSKSLDITGSAQQQSPSFGRANFDNIKSNENNSIMKCIHDAYGTWALLQASVGHLWVEHKK